MRLDGVEPGGFASGDDVDVPDHSEFLAVDPKIFPGQTFNPIPGNSVANPFAHRNPET
jgi:hypothetical protein